MNSQVFVVEVVPESDEGLRAISVYSDFNVALGALKLWYDKILTYCERTGIEIKEHQFESSEKTEASCVVDTNDGEWFGTVKAQTVHAKIVDELPLNSYDTGR